MDIKKSLVLEYFLTLSPAGEAVVVDKDDIIKTLADNKQMISVKELDMLIDNLKDTEFISVKYKDESMVCLTPLAKARIAVKQDKSEINELKKLSKTLKVDIDYKKIFILALAGGFIGCLVAVGLIALIKIMF